jgi:hypothetical protein
MMMEFQKGFKHKTKRKTHNKKTMIKMETMGTTGKKILSWQYMGNMLTTGHKVHGFKPSRGWWIFKSDKNL